MSLHTGQNLGNDLQCRSTNTYPSIPSLWKNHYICGHIFTEWKIDYLYSWHSYSASFLIHLQAIVHRHSMTLTNHCKWECLVSIWASLSFFWILMTKLKSRSTRCLAHLVTLYISWSTAPHFGNPLDSTRLTILKASTIRMSPTRNRPATRLSTTHTTPSYCLTMM